jgi:FCD domain
VPTAADRPREATPPSGTSRLPSLQPLTPSPWATFQAQTNLPRDLGSCEPEVLEEFFRLAALAVPVTDAEPPRGRRQYLAEQFGHGPAEATRDLCFLDGYYPAGPLRRCEDGVVVKGFDSRAVHYLRCYALLGEQVGGDLAMVADNVSPDDLMHVRRVLERESAALAAGHLSPDIHARMTGLCAQMRAPLPAQLITAADHEFHMLLLQCSGNAALRLLGATLSQSLHRSMLGMREFLAADRRAQLDMARAHERVLDAVLHGDSQRAWKEMDHHFTLNERITRRIKDRSQPAARDAGLRPAKAALVMPARAQAVARRPTRQDAADARFITGSRPAWRCRPRRAGTS